MAQKKKDKQYNGPKEERQTIQWPKRRKTDKTMDHTSQETTIAQQKFQYKTEDKLRSPEMY